MGGARIYAEAPAPTSAGSPGSYELRAGLRPRPRAGSAAQVDERADDLDELVVGSA